MKDRVIFFPSQMVRESDEVGGGEGQEMKCVFDEGRGQMV